MAIEIQLINQIEKYEFLYNFNLAEYNRKDIVEEAWGTIAANTNMTVSECKEKWRNIRSSFLRSMKQTGHKVKKPYYLTEYLKFILPFLKPISNLDNAEENQFDSHYTSNSADDIVVDFIKVEPDEFVGTDQNAASHADTVILNDLLSSNPAPMTTRRRKRFVTGSRKNHTEFVKNRNKATTAASKPANIITNGNNALRMFLLSLQPELETMTQEQVRLFKIKSMTLIDEIKTNYTQVKSNTTSLNSERLQKRLINLLLKNLEHSTKEKIAKEGN